MGFFTLEQINSFQLTASTIPLCGACGIYKHSENAKVPLYGNGKRKILIVCDYPNDSEVPFATDSGKLFRKWMESARLDVEEDCWVTYALICSPNKKTDIKANAVQCCKPNLNKVIKERQPEIIIVIGQYALDAVIIQDNNLESLNSSDYKKWVNWIIPDQKKNAWICPILNPSEVHKDKTTTTENYIMDNIRRISKLSGRPWNTVPNYQKQVQILKSNEQTIDFIRNVFMKSESVSFDYETDRLKPDMPGSDIICMSMSNGKETISFMLTKEVIPTVQDFLKSDVPKVGYNIKFEERWSRKVLNTPVKNWVWDGMLAAHVLDNRPGITGLKFQSYVLLGQGDYASHITPMLSAERGNDLNQVRKIHTEDLLIYCGMDSLLEHKVSKLQMKQMKKLSKKLHGVE